MTSINTTFKAENSEDYTEKTLDVILASAKYSAEERELSPQEVYIKPNTNAQIRYGNGELIDVSSTNTLDELELIHNSIPESALEIDSVSEKSRYPTIHFTDDEQSSGNFSDTFEAYAEIGLSENVVEESLTDQIRSVLNGKTPEEYAWERMSLDSRYSTNLNFISQYESDDLESSDGMVPFTSEEIDNIARNVAGEYEFIEDVSTPYKPGSQVRELEDPEPSSEGEKVIFGLI